MKKTTRTVPEVTYASDVRPEVATHDPSFEAAIVWADAHPVVWKIVSDRSRSAPFGVGSSTYIGWAQKGMSAMAVLQRVRTLQTACMGEDGFWRWRARFTLAHFEDRGFRGGLFQQWDGEYPRGCCSLDYTPATLDEVIGRFLGWCGGLFPFPTVEVRIDGKTVRKMPLDRRAHARAVFDQGRESVQVGGYILRVKKHAKKGGKKHGKSAKRPERRGRP